MRKFLAVAAIVTCSLLAAGPAGAQGSSVSCTSCRDNCYEAVDCTDFCAKKCAGACRARWQKALRGCFNQECRPPKCSWMGAKPN